MKRVAIKIRDLDKKESWHTGSALYKVAPPVEVNYGGFLTETEYIIVAVTPKAIDTDRPETALFAAKQNGKLFKPSEGYEAGSCNFLGVYVRGRQDHEAALNKLQGGYCIVQDEQIVIDALRIYRERIEGIRKG